MLTAASCLQRVAVVAHRALALRGVARLEEQVERRHAALDVEVPDHDHLAVLLDRGRRDGLQLVDQLRREARARERDIRVLERVRHAADAIVVLHQHVLLLDLLAGRCPSTRAILSRMTLNTYGYDGSVNTVITRPLMPGAMMKQSVECLRWCRKSRKNSVLPCFCRPTIV